MTEKTRQPRASETREATARRKTWSRPSALPTPDPRNGVVFRWIRTSVMDKSDSKNVSTRFREGWTPVKREDHPELEVLPDLDSRFPENIEVGGLLLCQCAAETMDERKAYYAQMSADQMTAVDNDFMRLSDPRMPVLRPERSTRSDFGEG